MTAPTAAALSATLSADNTFFGGVNLGKASTYDHPTGVFSLVAQASHGAAVVNADGSWHYRPDPSFTGTDSFTYHIVDTNGTATAATVTLTVRSDVEIIHHGPIQPAPNNANIVGGSKATSENLAKAGSYTTVYGLAVTTQSGRSDAASNTPDAPLV